MLVSYNGIVFQIVRVTDFVREAVYTPDLTTYLYDSISIRLECLLNLGATTGEDYSQQQTTQLKNNKANPGKDPPADNPANQQNTAGPATIPRVTKEPDSPWSPVRTYNELANRLKVPRKKLLVWMDSKLTSPEGNAAGIDPGEIILESPLPGFAVDAINGPHCKVHRLDGFHGNSTLWMDVEFQTSINTCSAPNLIQNPEGVMIGNTWTFTIEHDPDTHTAIHNINGMAVFRGDLLNKIGVIPDQFRKLFIHPIPDGFQRSPPTLVYHPDNHVVEYQIIDREQLANFVGGQLFNATRIEVSESRQYERPLFGNGRDSAKPPGWGRRQLRRLNPFHDDFGKFDAEV